MPNYYSKVFFTLLLLFSAVIGYSQNTKLVTGTIKDANDVPLTGATVSAQNASKINAVTNAAGVYAIKVPENTSNLIVSYVGMRSVTISIQGKANVDIVLKEADSKLSEVVVVGYGTKRRADVTSSISSITEKDIKNLPVAGVDQALQGKVAGVSVTSNSGQPGGGVSVKVRGITSVNGTEPLYVIDGVPILSNTSSASQDQLGGRGGQTQQSVLATLNPNDIASIDILKDASAQAIYGSLAGNGVVLITTKRGKSGAGKIQYDVYYGFQKVPKILPVLDLKQYAQYVNSLVPEIRAAGSNLDTIAEFRNPDVLGQGTNWQNEIFQVGLIQNHQLAFSGGFDKTNYYLSLNYFNQTGTIVGSKFERYSVRFNLDQQVRQWIKVGVSSNLSRSDQKITLTDGAETPTAIVLYNSPATPVKDAFGQYITTTNVGGNTLGNSNSNPIATSLLRDVRSVQTKAYGNVYAELAFGKHFTLRNEVNFDFQLTQNKAYQPFILNANASQVILAPARLREDRGNGLYAALRNYLTYNQNFGKHYFNATIGHEEFTSNYDQQYTTSTDLQLNLPTTSAGTILPSGSGGGKYSSSQESYFARLNYTYNNKYSFSGSGRRDGSSTFGPNKRLGYFYAGSVGWTASNENFFKNVKFINYLKLRAGYGSVGNQNSPVQNPYTTNIRIFPISPFGPGGIPANVGNPDISWEAVVTKNVGIDLTFFNRKVELTVDAYNKTTTRMILASILPAFAGLDPNPPNNSYRDIEPPVTNAGEIRNRGIDVALTTYNINKKNMSWKTTVVFSQFKNKLIRLNAPGATLKGQEQDFTGISSVVNYTTEGRSIGNFYGYVTNGLYTSLDQLRADGIILDPVNPKQGIYLGDIRYKDLNGDGVIDSKDVTFIGDPNPKFTYGITNTFSYKGFDLSVFIQGSYGGKIFNWTRKYSESLGSPYLNQLSTVLNRYTEAKGGNNASLPRYNQWNSNNLRNSDRFVENGSYLRIQNVALGYNVPVKWAKYAKMVNARLYVSAQNLLTVTKYSGYDPEIGSYNKSVLSQNVDNGHYPNPRTITFGANIEF